MNKKNLVFTKCNKFIKNLEKDAILIKEFVNKICDNSEIEYDRKDYINFVLELSCFDMGDCDPFE